MLVTGIVALVSSMVNDLGMQTDQLRDLFIRIATQVQASLKLKVPPEKAWRKLKKEMAT